MTLALSYFIRRNLLDNFWNRWAFIGDGIAIVLNLTVFWYTSKAFGSAFAEGSATYGTDYFTFVIVGDLVITIPLAFFAGISQAVRTTISEGTFDTFRLLRRGLPYALTMMVLGSLPREILRNLVMLLLAITIFGLKLPNGGFAAILLFQLLFLPVFLALGFAVAALTLYLQRGAGFVSHVAIVISILSGTFFPLSVFPGWVQSASRFGSPFTLLVQMSREHLAGGTWQAGPVVAELIAGLVLLPISIWLFNFALKKVAKNGSPLLVRV